ncbi:MAG: 4Fe-4S dicluster domain-containing protein [Ignavibacteriae bacterium]|nr:4Fe-4S dicluster domain-containing protein [Ignavibacteriota bacterium]
MEKYTITADNLQAFADGLVAKGHIVIGESPDGREFTAVRNGEALRFRAGETPTKLSFKSQVFPKTEAVFYYRKSADDVVLFEPELPTHTTVVFGARPCDAKSIGTLSKVFNWDYKDEYFNTRADNTVIVGMPCTYRDQHCFCTSVGLSPVSMEGSDIFLEPQQGGGYAVRVLTPKGASLLAQFPALFADGTAVQDQPAAAEGPEKRFDAVGVREWIRNNFESETWKSFGENCVGCAQCAFACPVCHCFDIVDESEGFLEGRRMKNWDACQHGLFTKHASGHNPRDDQGKRYRQRVSHKFSYYPERFGEILCTGCGRCSRGCAMGVDIAEIVGDIHAKCQ